MTNLNIYILGVSAAALICSILMSLADSKSSVGLLTRMICGLFLSLVVIEPLCKLRNFHVESFIEAIQSSEQAYISAGSEMAMNARRGLIKSETEAYILDKASSYRAQLEVEVMLSDDEITFPESVVISGAVSPYAKNYIQKLISNDLGIPKERQLWIG